MERYRSADITADGSRHQLPLVVMSLCAILISTAVIMVFTQQAGATAHDGVLVFASDRDGEFDLWTISASGGEPVQLADQTGDDQFPRWSPDGTQVAYIKNPNTTSGRLWLIDADGSNPHVLVSIQARFPPAWSPDGSKIAFVAHSGDGDFDLHVVGRDGSGLTKLADTPENETYVAWLDTGIAVVRGESVVIVEPTTGADTTSFAIGPGGVGLDGSPDGTSVLFSQQVTTGVRMAILDTTSGTITQVSDGSERDLIGSWSPDGGRVAFGRGSSAQDLYVIGVDGGGLTQLTSSVFNDLRPDWFGSSSLPVLTVDMQERIGVADLVGFQPVTVITIDEGVGVVDFGSVALATLIEIDEHIGVADEVVTHLPIAILIGESIGLDDVVIFPSPVEIVIDESIGLDDVVILPSPVEIVIDESIGLDDVVILPSPVGIVIGESIGLRDLVGLRSPVMVVVGEGVGLADRFTASPYVTVETQEGIAVEDLAIISLAVQVEVVDGQVTPGDEVEFSGHGFAPGSAIEVGIESTFCLLTTTTADADGAFSVLVTIPGPEQCPGLEAGSHTLVALGVDPNGVSYRVQAPLSVRAPVDVLLSPANPMSVLVDTPLMLSATFTDVSGDLTNQEFDPDAAFIRLEPVGPGSPVEPAWCHTTALEGEYLVECAFTGPPVNTYTVLAAVDSGHFYGSDEGVLTVYDPALGFTTGGGWLEWPENGERTGFGFTIKHNKKGTNVLGSFVLVRASDEGARLRVKSNALEGLALGSEPGHSWATFTGKATYLSPEAPEPEGNYTFVVYVEDGRPDEDRFWLEVRDRDGNVVIAISLAKPPSENAVIVSGGDIQVPHLQGRGPR